MSILSGETQSLRGERPETQVILGQILKGPFPAKLRPTMIDEGDKAPEFDLETDDGKRISLASLEGRNVVLFFYPKDNTSG